MRFLQHYKQTQALRLIVDYARQFEKAFGRKSGGLLRAYRADDADMLIVALGSVCGTIKDVIDEMRDDGIAIGLVTIVSYRPFPTDDLRKVLAGAQDVVVVEKSVAVGVGGPLANNVDMALRNLPDAPRLHSAVAGLGGRAITKPSLHRLFRQASVQPWEGTHFLDLNERIVGREIHTSRKKRRSGPTAENLLRRLATEEARHEQGHRSARA